ncbi:acyltransferase family protein [Thalassovita taeanensis]|uniref:Peptidoglycan/LPS O-acetylase OafA/YrhL, contains acyltransferase and SGNH-hydrolase domains n=1 Tax=Thalassovita taeanensis TaxID=657014 RepID=A0A1H9C0R2_9RHOB|nr:acyltransferase family protein [Thalassovita taeanensis]SEP94759.1 Peptidoglycan/LPS O-acetylase OafA/YrhL, contains acyltransferase and SGNH-hydrolase domains [Thalassovita taeanensis]
MPSGTPIASGYRPEIDGLRAIAVLSVVLYHFGVPGLSGGFVGVDVFFVISGFLIGGILWAELGRTGTLSLGRFYMRRFKRLAPAFFVMALITAVVGYFVLLPFEYRAFGKSLIAATVYLSNVQFFREAGYFDSGADEKILLHTWSLAVEEQFYVVLPLIFLLFRASRRSLLVVLVMAFVASLAACVLITPRSPTAAFYLFPFRAWELLAGVLLAIWRQARDARWSWHPALSWLGLWLLVYAVLFTRAGAGFPGYQAVMPVLGTGLILMNGQNRNPVNHLLASGPVVFVGLISYSLYLWHWPVVTLSAYYRGAYSGWVEMLLWMALAFGLAVLSWRWIERSTRHAQALRLREVLVGVGALSVVTLGLGGWIYKANGLPGRFGPEVRRHIDASADFIQDWSRCSVPGDGPLQGVEVCGIGPDGPPQVVFWGDSHLRALMDGIGVLAQEKAVPGLLIWHAGCPPLFGIAKVETAATPAQDTACTQANATIRAALSGMGSLRAVALIGRWSYYAEGVGVGRDVANRITLLPASGGQAADFAGALSATVRELTRDVAPVFVLRQVPEIPFYQSRTVARRLAHGQGDGVEAVFSAPLSEIDARSHSADVALHQLASRGAISLIDPRPRLCDAVVCSVLRGDQVLYFDNNHLTNAGARALRDLFLPVFRQGKRPVDGG